MAAIIILAVLATGVPSQEDLASSLSVRRRHPRLTDSASFTTRPTPIPTPQPVSTRWSWPNWTVVTSAISRIGRGFRHLCRLDLAEIGTWTALQGVAGAVYIGLQRRWLHHCSSAGCGVDQTDPYVGALTTLPLYVVGVAAIPVAVFAARRAVQSDQDLLMIVGAMISAAINGFCVLPWIEARIVDGGLQHASSSLDRGLLALLPGALLVFALRAAQAVPPPGAALPRDLRAVTGAVRRGLLALTAALAVLSAAQPIWQPALASYTLQRKFATGGAAQLPFPIVRVALSSNRVGPIVVDGTEVAALRQYDERDAFFVKSSLNVDTGGVVVGSEKLSRVEIVVPNRGSGAIRGFCGDRHQPCLVGAITFDGVSGQLTGTVRFADNGVNSRVVRLWASSWWLPSSTFYVDDQVAAYTRPDWKSLLLFDDSDRRYLFGRDWNHAILMSAFLNSQFRVAAHDCHHLLQSCQECCRLFSKTMRNRVGKKSKRITRYYCESCKLGECANLHETRCRGLLPALSQTAIEE